MEIIRKVMNWHAARSDEFRSPIVRGMARASGRSRDRVLNDDEFRAVWRATSPLEVPLAASISPAFGAYVRFLRPTAARRSEAAKMQWARSPGVIGRFQLRGRRQASSLSDPCPRAARTSLRPSLGLAILRSPGMEKEQWAASPS